MFEMSSEWSWRNAFQVSAPWRASGEASKAARPNAESSGSGAPNSTSCDQSRSVLAFHWSRLPCS